MKQFIYLLSITFFLLLSTEKANALETLWLAGGSGDTQLPKSAFPVTTNGCESSTMTAWLHMNDVAAAFTRKLNIHVTLSPELRNKGVKVSIACAEKGASNWYPITFDSNGKGTIDNFIEIEGGEREWVDFKFESTGVGGSGTISIYADADPVTILVADIQINTQNVASNTMTFRSATEATSLTFQNASDNNITLDKTFNLVTKNSCYTSELGTPRIRITSTDDPRNYLKTNNNEFLTGTPYYCETPMDNIGNMTTGSGSVTDISLNAKPEMDTKTFTFMYSVVSGTSPVNTWGNTISQTVIVPDTRTVFTSTPTNRTISCTATNVTLEISSPARMNESAKIKISSTLNPANIFSLEGVTFTNVSGAYVGYIPITFSATGTASQALAYNALPGARKEAPIITYTVVSNDPTPVQLGVDSKAHTLTFDAISNTAFTTEPDEITPESAIDCSGYQYSVAVSSPCQGGKSAVLEISSSTITSVFSLEYRYNNTGNYNLVAFSSEEKVSIPLTFNTDNNETVYFRLTALPNARHELPTLTYKVMDPVLDNVQWGTGSLVQEILLDVLSATTVEITDLDGILAALEESNNTIGCEGLSIPYTVTNVCQANQNAYAVLDLRDSDAQPSLRAASIFNYLSVTSENGTISTESFGRIIVNFQLDEEGSFSDVLTIKPTNISFPPKNFAFNSSLNVYTADDFLLGNASMENFPEMTLDPAGITHPQPRSGFTSGMDAVNEIRHHTIRNFIANFFTTDCMIGAPAQIILQLENPADAEKFRLKMGGQELIFNNGNAMVDFETASSLNFAYTIESLANWDEKFEIPINCILTINGSNLIFTEHMLVIFGPSSYINILSQPEDAVVCIGGNHTFNVRADGPNLKYQWYKGNNPIQGAINTSLTLTNLTLEDYELYYVKITTSNVSEISYKARLWVSSPLSSNLAFAECPTQATAGESYTVSLDGNIDITKYTWKYSLDGATFSPASGTKNETSVVFNNNAFGQGTLTVELEHPCGAREVSQVVNVKYPTGMDDVTVEKISVYPNPVRDWLTINSKVMNITNVTINDISGRIVYKTKIEKLECQLSTSGWAKGTYIITITLENGKKVINKVIKL